MNFDTTNSHGAIEKEKGNGTRNIVYRYVCLMRPQGPGGEWE